MPVITTWAHARAWLSVPADRPPPAGWALLAGLLPAPMPALGTLPKIIKTGTFNLQLPYCIGM